MKVRVIRLAQRDIERAAAYYRAQRIGLDDEFLREIESAVAAIAATPRRFEQVSQRMRRYLLDRFPFAVCYRIVDAESVEIVVVKHHSRRPGFGMRRK